MMFGWVFAENLVLLLVINVVTPAPSDVDALKPTSPTKVGEACDRLSQDIDCLKVLSSTPAHLPKCYCTSLCPKNLTSLVATCASGQLVWDECGYCLSCAGAQGESCGGPHQVAGVCSTGLTCLVKFNDVSGRPDKTQEAENLAVGKCVPQNHPDCPPAGLLTLSRVNCRPGRVGIPADTIYCPSGLEQPKRTEKLPDLFESLFGRL